MMKFGVEFTADVGALEEMVTVGVKVLIAEGADKVSGVVPNVEVEASAEIEREEIIRLPVPFIRARKAEKSLSEFAI
jgi:hypothetical protein